MQYVDKPISRSQLRQYATETFGQLVKAVVDIEKKVMVVDADLHADQERYLLERGSQQEYLWGINLYPDVYDDDFVEFDSMINIRPRQHNASRSVENIDIQNKIRNIVNSLVSE